MKPQKIVLVEYIDDIGNYAWYGVYTDATEATALMAYFQEMHDDDEKPDIRKGNEGYWYEDNTEARAIEIDLVSLAHIKRDH